MFSLATGWSSCSDERSVQPTSFGRARTSNISSSQYPRPQLVPWRFLPLWIWKIHFGHRHAILVPSPWGNGDYFSDNIIFVCLRFATWIVHGYAWINGGRCQSELFQCNRKKFDEYVGRCMWRGLMRCDSSRRGVEERWGPVRAKGIAKGGKKGDASARSCPYPQLGNGKPMRKDGQVSVCHLWRKVQSFGQRRFSCVGDRYQIADPLSQRPRMILTMFIELNCVQFLYFGYSPGNEMFAPRLWIVLSIRALELSRVPGQPLSHLERKASLHGASQAFLRAQRRSPELNVPIGSRSTISKFQVHCVTRSNHLTYGNFPSESRNQQYHLQNWENVQRGHSHSVSRIIREKKLPEIQGIANESDQIIFLIVC
jgi:hypothetical protein